MVWAIVGATFVSLVMFLAFVHWFDPRSRLRRWVRARSGAALDATESELRGSTATAGLFAFGTSDLVAYLVACQRVPGSRGPHKGWHFNVLAVRHGPGPTSGWHAWRSASRPRSLVDLFAPGHTCPGVAPLLSFPSRAAPLDAEAFGTADATPDGFASLPAVPPGVSLIRTPGWTYLDVPRDQIHPRQLDALLALVRASRMIPAAR